MTKANNNLRIGFGFSIVLLIISSAVSYICIQNLLSSANWVRHTNEVKATLEGVISSLKDAETGQRGFLLTGNDEYLEPYNGAYDNALRNVDKVLDLTTDNSIQQESGKILKSSLIKRVARMQLMIDKKRAGQQVDFEDMRVGKTYMDSVRKQVDRMNTEENHLLAIRTETQEKFAFYTPIVIIIAALLAILVSVIFYMRIIKDMRERTKLQQELQQKDKETTQRIHSIRNIASKISGGDYTVRIKEEREKDSLGDVAGALNSMAESLAFSFGKLSDNEWLQRGIAQLNEKMVGEKDLSALTHQIIEYTTAYTGSHVGALYLLDKEMLILNSGYALLDSTRREIPVGQGIVGQAISAQHEILLEDVDPEYVTVSHATGNIRPRSVIAFPVFNEGDAIGVLELAAIKPYTERDLLFIKTAVQNIGSAIYSAINHKKLQELLEETQAQSEELQAQHSELENMNAELEAHTQKLQTSEEELRVQQEELQQSNFELEERNRIINDRNLEIIKKADELEQSTRYKSEFMANMSHELRTPLNSILLLSRYLSENNEENLTEDQMESARVIFNSGNGLLDLIDELLDLSKIEAGKMEVEYSRIMVPDLLNDIQSLFLPVAKEKHIQLKINEHLGESKMMESDRMKLEQILKNLLSNALKFTTIGSVTLTVAPVKGKENYLSFAVEDTGVGIANDKLGLVFEAFTQADGSTKRKYGGTGLGLSISRQLARLLGGEITVTSEPDKGSIFTLTIPAARIETPVENISFPQPAPYTTGVQYHELQSRSRFVTETIPEEIDDDRHTIQSGDKVILIIEDDTAFAKALQLFTKKQNYKCLVAVRGDEGIKLARQYKPLAILLDIQLPVLDGWEVMEELKSNSDTRHIPVHVMSSLEVKRESRMHGAVDFINKPVATEQMKQIFDKLEAAVNKSPKRVLIVEENAKHAKALSQFLEDYNVAASVQHTIADSINTLRSDEVDCVILDMGIPDKNAYDTLETVKATPGMEDIPIIIFTGKNLSHAEESRIKQYADSIVVKTAHSYQRILDEVGLFLHLVEEKKNRPGRGLERGLTADILNGKTVLIADDDVRNIFSLTKSLERHNVKVITATDGAEALTQLDEHPETDIVLMDMMMPQMDGYESTTKIRQHPRFKNIPVIAVTAKAMLGDREKCIAAGASDYISKPVDIDQLISLLRVWLYDKQGNL
jgi:CheY-like chemotaxis protein/CHASE3 domain sensor protein/putative methionine-R-sulfoxide reductase with GAF domain